MLLSQHKWILLSIFSCSKHTIPSNKQARQRRADHTWECDLGARDRSRCISRTGLHDTQSTIHTEAQSHFNHVNEILLALERADPFGVIWTTTRYFLTHCTLAVDFDVRRIVEEDNCGDQRNVKVLGVDGHLSSTIPRNAYVVHIHDIDIGHA